MAQRRSDQQDYSRLQETSQRLGQSFGQRPATDSDPSSKSPLVDMTAKRRDRRQRRIDLKQALQDRSSPKRDPAPTESPLTYPSGRASDEALGSRYSSTVGPSSFGDRPRVNAPTEGPKSEPGRADSRSKSLKGVRQFQQPETAGQPNRPRRSPHLMAVNPSDPSQGARQEYRPTSPPRVRSSEKPSLFTSISLYTVRLMILGIGVGVIAGTFLYHWNPTERASLSQAKNRPAKPAEQDPSVPTATFPAVRLSKPIAPLTKTIQTILTDLPNDLTPTVMVINADTGNYVDINSTRGVPAASTIKLAILVAFFQDVDAGKIRLDEPLRIQDGLIASGSGNMQYQPVGTQFTAWETALKMIIISDNTATNMLIHRMGGMAALNKRFKDWGMTTTTLQNLLPDLSGTNTTSARDLADLLLQINQGRLVSPRSRDRIFSIMQRTENNNLLPQGLGEGALIAHKTGDIGIMIGDVGLVDMPNGGRYIIATLVQRPYNDTTPMQIIREISQATYNYLSKPIIAASPTPSPSPSSASPSPKTP